MVRREYDIKIDLKEMGLRCVDGIIWFKTEANGRLLETQ
jgi:hypothetical protein